MMLSTTIALLLGASFGLQGAEDLPLDRKCSLVSAILNSAATAQHFEVAMKAPRDGNGRRVVDVRLTHFDERDGFTQTKFFRAKEQCPTADFQVGLADGSGEPVASILLLLFPQDKVAAFEFCVYTPNAADCVLNGEDIGGCDGDAILNKQAWSVKVATNTGGLGLGGLGEPGLPRKSKRQR